MLNFLFETLVQALYAVLLLTCVTIVFLGPWVMIPVAVSRELLIMPSPVA